MHELTDSKDNITFPPFANVINPKSIFWFDHCCERYNSLLCLIARFYFGPGYVII